MTLQEFFSSTPVRKQVSQLKKNPELLEELNTLYPNVETKNAVNAYRHQVNPYCVVCANPLEIVFKDTCSYACKNEHQRASGALKERSKKTKATNLSKYGVENPMQHTDINKKAIQTKFEKYGCGQSPKGIDEARSRVVSLNKKGRKTLKERYGVCNAGQLSGHKKKLHDARIRNYDENKELLKSIEASKSRHVRFQRLSKSVELHEIMRPEHDWQALYRIKFKCKECSSIETLPTETFKWRIRNFATPCRQCSGIFAGSAAQYDLYNCISDMTSAGVDLNVKPFKDSRLEIDIFSKEHNIGIEYCGLWWHSEKFDPVSCNTLYHKNKLEKSLEHGFSLIHIFEDEWVNNRDLVLARIRSKLGVQSAKVAARKCVVKEIGAAAAREFVDRNHMQGYAPATIKLGLFHEENLVSVMTFSKLSKSKGMTATRGHWEISRFCSKSNLSVVGGSGKLFAFFKREFDPEYVVTFSDRRWGEGHHYLNLGFEFKHNTRPNYWYVNCKDVKRYHRFAYRKNKDDDPNLTEWENRQKQGLTRIWDCGSAKYEWRRQ